jgi:dolichol-phosphate mannosyltransferase
MYNEADNVRPLVHAIREHAPHAAILLIDDSSPDGTGAIADELARTLPDITVVHRPGKQGLGSAIVHAMRHAVAHGYDYYLNLDADFSHPPRFIPALLAGMRDRDVMIGSRYVPGGGVEGEFGLRRKLMSRGINGLARLCFGLDTQDNSGSFRCYRVTKLAQIDFDRVRSRGYSFMEEILFLCKQVGCTMGETPILFEDRRAGRSKLNKAEAVRSVAIIVQLGLARLTA